MKTALVTTCHLNTDDYFEKTRKFIKYYLIDCKDLKIDKLYLVDNASSAEKIKLIEDEFSDLPIEFVKFTEFIDRPSHLEYGYVWRAIYHMRHFFDSGFEKLIYANNDFFLMSSKIVEYVNNLDSGWNAFWCPKHKFPEADIMIVSKNCTEYQNFVKSGNFMEHNGRMLETLIPLTNINKVFKSDRWSEYGLLEIPKDADLSAQTLLSMEVIYRK